MLWFIVLCIGMTILENGSGRMPEKKVRGKDLRASDKAFRKDRRERAKDNRGSYRDKNGNVFYTQRFQDGNVPFEFKVRRQLNLAEERAKPENLSMIAKEKLLHARIVAGIEHPKITKAVVIITPILLFTVLAILTGEVGFCFGIFIFPIFATAVQPQEILGTGIVEAYASEFGATNNSAKLQAAIDYCETNGKRSIYLGNEAWALDTTILFPKSTADWYLTGNNREFTVLTSTVNGANVIETEWDNPNRVTGITFSRFKLDGGGAEWSGIYCYYAVSVFLEQVTIDGMGFHGLFIERVHMGLVNSCEFDSNINYDIEQRYSNAIRYLNDKAIRGGLGGLYMREFCINTMVIGCNFSENTNYGILIDHSSTDNTILSSYFEGNGLYNIRLLGTALLIVRSITIMHCYLSGGGVTDVGIEMRYAEYCDISSNYLWGYVTSCIRCGIGGGIGETDSIHIWANSIGLLGEAADTFLIIEAPSANTRVGVNNYINVGTYLTDGGTNTILPTITVPFILVGGGSAQNDDGIDIDAGGEYARAYEQLPSECNQLQSVDYYGVMQDTDADGMQADLLIEGGKDNEPKNTHSVNSDDQTSKTLNFAADDIGYWRQTGVTAFTGNDNVMVEFRYHAVTGDNIATDFAIRTASLRYL